MMYFNAESIKTIDLHPELIFTEQFKIYDTSNILMESRNISKITIEEAIKNIDSYEKTTGIMIGDFSITENNSLFLFIFDNIILLINEIYLHKFQIFFDKNKEENMIFYLNTKCIEEIQKMTTKEQIITQTTIDQTNQQNQPQLLLEKISECIIKKSQLRTLNRYYGLIPNNESIQTELDKNRFINIKKFIGTNHVFLSYNIRDQFLYILKYFDESFENSRTRFNREVSFYESHNGNNPYICKYYGSDDTNLIIFTEYIEGQTLKEFIDNEREKLIQDERLTIILEIMSAIEYLHVNGFMYRDLKINNIIIDYEHKAKLIDFDQIKIYEENQQTVNIGSDLFVSPEQLSSNYYSFQTDIYSLGKVIEFIFSYCEKSESDWDFYNKYKYCMEKSPENRPRIGNLLTNAFIIYLDSKNPQSHFKEIFEVRKKLFEFSLKTKIDKDKIIDLYTFMGSCYLDGDLISQDINKGVKFLKVACEENDSDAQLYLGISYLEDKYHMKNVSTAIRYLEHSSKNNNSNAQSYLGLIYYEGEIVRQDVNKAIKYLELSSKQNNSSAQAYLGDIYYIGEYVQRNVERSIQLLELSVKQNNSEAQATLGIIYYEGKYVRRDVKKAIHFLELSSKQNNSTAQLYLSEIFYEGKYIHRDIYRAIYYLTPLADKNNAIAQSMLGSIYFEGKYISRDINKAIKYLTLSSNQNNPDAQLTLGLIYYNGKYVKQDINKAIYYLKLSSDQNNPGAQLYLGMIYLLHEYVPFDIKKVILYFKLSSNQNNSIAQFYLGLIFYKGKYVPQNINKAINYFLLSSEQYNSDALFYLGMIYYDGKYIPKDINKAIHYFKESSSLNDTRSKNNLGVIYKNGDGVEKNIYHAIEYFEEAIRKGNDPYAIINLARIYYLGIDIEPDIPKSIELLEKSSKNNYEAAIFLSYIQMNKIFNEIKNNLENSFVYDTSNYFLSNLINQCYNHISNMRDLLQKFDFVYSENKYLSLNIFNHNQQQNKINLTKNINNDFYEGFYKD